MARQILKGTKNSFQEEKYSHCNLKSNTQIKQWIRHSRREMNELKDKSEGFTQNESQNFKQMEFVDIKETQRKDKMRKNRENKENIYIYFHPELRKTSFLRFRSPENPKQNK